MDTQEEIKLLLQEQKNFPTADSVALVCAKIEERRTQLDAEMASPPSSGEALADL